MLDLRTSLEIRIRPLATADAQALHAAVRRSIGSLSYWLPWCRPEYSLADAEAWIAHCIEARQKGSEFHFAINDDGGEEILGCVGLSKIDPANRTANLGYWVSEPHRSRGVATRAIALAAAVAFEELGMVRLEIVALAGNLASQRAAEKAGAVREAEARNRLVFHGAPADAVVYSLIPGDLDVLPS